MYNLSGQEHAYACNSLAHISHQLACFIGGYTWGSLPKSLPSHGYKKAVIIT